MFGGKKRIRIEFFDVETGQMIGFDEKKPKQIPPTFRFDTHVKIRGKLWKLVEAEPFERKKFIKSGLLTIKLKLEEDQPESSLPPIPEEKQLFRSPSRPASYPESGSRRKGKLLEMRQAEWRSIELISQRYRSEISREMGKIESIRLNSSTDQDGQVFYLDQYTRDLPADVVELEGLAVSTLEKTWFPFSNSFDGLSFMTEEGATSNTFAFGLPAGLTLYGQTERGVIQCLGLVPPPEKHKLIALQDIQRLVQFMDAHGLVMVDWNEMRFLEPIEPVLAKYFGVSADESETLDTTTPSENEPDAPISLDSGQDQILEASVGDSVTEETAPEAESKSEEEKPSEDLLFTANPETKEIAPPLTADRDLMEFRIDHSLEGEDSSSDEEE